MFLFSKKRNYLGVDIGTSSIKIVELTSEKGSPRLVTYGYIEQPTNIIKDDSRQAREKIISLIKGICAKAKTTTKLAVTALPSFSVFSSVINLPPMPKKDLAAAVSWEAKKFVPMPIEEVALDWKVLEQESIEPDLSLKDKAESPSQEVPNPSDLENSEEETKEKNLKILLTAASKKLVRRYIDIFKSAGLELLSLETESFALSRSLAGSDPHEIMIIDLGAIASDIIIMKRGIPLLSRSIDVGGVTLTKSIANSLNIDEIRAEQFKRDIGVPTKPQTSLTPMVSQAGSEQIKSSGDGGGIPKAIGIVMDSLINEIRYSLELYQNQSSSKIEKIILSGGSAFLANLTDYFSRVLSCRVYIGNPWDRIIYPKELRPVLEGLGPRFAVAVGLAMREID